VPLPATVPEVQLQHQMQRNMDDINVIRRDWDQLTRARSLSSYLGCVHTTCCTV